jgi:hypothetical protein
MVSINPSNVFAEMDISNSQNQISTFSEVHEIEIIVDVLKELGLEINNVEFIEQNLLKSCKLTVKGTFNGKEIEVVLIIEGMSCEEVIKALTEK